MTMLTIIIERKVYYEARCQVVGCGWWDRFQVNSRDAQESAKEHNQDAHAGQADIKENIGGNLHAN